MDETEWIAQRMAELVAEHGTVPPPWVLYPDAHPYDLLWRMGDGEAHLIVFDAWWQGQQALLDETQRIDYFRQWPPPPRWLTWMMEVVWDLEPDDPEPFDYGPYFARSEALGFASQADYERDIADPKWLE